MDIPLREQGIYRFGPFQLDPTRRVLTRDGGRIKLAERLFDALLYLVVNHGRLVERDELLRAVWGTRIVEANNLAQAIRALRQALQIEESAETFIVTTPNRGYRFAAPVIFEPAPLETGTPAEFLLTAPSRPAALPREVPARRSWVTPLTACIAGLALLLAAIGLINRTRLGPPDESAFAPPAHSVAVLAFENMTGDPQQAYFSDGLSVELIDALGRVGAVQVAARTSAFSFKGSTATIATIARKLNVGAVLEGSVRRDGDRVRIAADLVDARSGLQLWSRSYDRDRTKGDLLSVQGDIAAAVASALEVRLAGEDTARLTSGGTHDPRALDAYLHGAMIAATQDDTHCRAAIGDYDKAIALDPDYALAYVGRATALTYLSANGEGGNVTESRAELAAAAADIDHAISLAPMLAQPHLQKAQILLYRLDFKGELSELERALDLSPGSSDAESRFGQAESMLGHFDKALPAVRHAILLDPLVSRTYRNLGRVLHWQRHFDEALDAYHQAETLDPHPSFAKQDQAVLVYLAKGEWDIARRMCETGSGWSKGQCLAMAYHALGRQGEAQGVMESLQKTYGDDLAYNYAEIYAQWGQPDQAVHWLQKAFRLKDPGLCELLVDPFLDPIRQRAEFAEIQKLLNFPA
jgi:TolB-like protein/DNA-binding winged helix-turn-helix (wHTH) protein/Tfp pilus assembly protein PilF